MPQELLTGTIAFTIGPPQEAAGTVAIGAAFTVDLKLNTVVLRNGKTLFNIRLLMVFVHIHTTLSKLNSMYICSHTIRFTVFYILITHVSSFVHKLRLCVNCHSKVTADLTISFLLGQSNNN